MVSLATSTDTAGFGVAPLSLVAGPVNTASVCGGFNKSWGLDYSVWTVMSIYASSSLKKNLNSSHSKRKKRKSRNCSTVYMWGDYNNRMVSVSSSAISLKYRSWLTLGGGCRAKAVSVPTPVNLPVFCCYRYWISGHVMTHPGVKKLCPYQVVFKRQRMLKKRQRSERTVMEGILEAPHKWCCWQALTLFIERMNALEVAIVTPSRPVSAHLFVLPSGCADLSPQSSRDSFVWAVIPMQCI